MNFVVVNFLIVTICLYYVRGAAVAEIKGKGEGAKKACLARVKACEEGGPRRPVCGSDGKTYSSKCQLMQAQCLGERITVSHRGHCTEGQQACLLALRYALNTPHPAFVPRCRADGSYAATQCGSGATASCWCVNPAGKPLPNTAVRNGRPDCTPTGKSHTRRRSSIRGQRNKKTCSRGDRVIFNANLLKSFNGEYERSLSGIDRQSLSAMDSKAISDWKFKELNKNGDAALQKSEYRGLRRLIKKVVKPRRCARTWVRNCDTNADGNITIQEWTSCLLAPPPPRPDHLNEGDAEPNTDYGEEEPPPDPSGVLHRIPIRGEVSPDGDSDSRHDDDINDCLTDRQAVLDEQKAGSPALYVPECTGDGRYARAQCYRSTGYCWCVHQDTGKPIPGSSVKDKKPDCDSAPHHASPMRGCPEPMKTNFLRNLMKLFIVKMTSSTNGTIPGSGEMVKWGASREEQAATWTFVMLDNDKNKALEKREWKAFHQLISNVEELKRCGRKLPRYCDVNHDMRISITEWLACLDVAPAYQKLSTTTETFRAPPNPRRKGPNPLESILKADD